MRRTIALVVLLGLLSGTAHAQLPVTDVASLAELIAMAERVRETIALMREEYATLQRIGRGYRGDLTRYLVPAVPTLNHDSGRWLYAAALLDGFNAGDPRGERYYRVVRELQRPGGLLTALTPEARRIVEAAFATIEVYDSVATLGVHESALSRGYGTRIATLIERLEADVTNPGSEFHETTAIADKLTLAGLIHARQNQSSNQVESSILEQLIAKNTRTRNAAAATANLTITALTDKGEMSSTMVAGSGAALRNWRLP